MEPRKAESFILFPLKITIGGTYCLIAKDMVIVWPLSPLVTEETTLFTFGAITLSGLCTYVNLDKSQLYILPGSKFKYLRALPNCQNNVQQKFYSIQCDFFWFP